MLGELLTQRRVMSTVICTNECYKQKCRGVCRDIYTPLACPRGTHTPYPISQEGNTNNHNAFYQPEHLSNQSPVSTPNALHHTSMKGGDLGRSRGTACRKHVHRHRARLAGRRLSTGCRFPLRCRRCIRRLRETDEVQGALRAYLC